MDESPSLVSAANDRPLPLRMRPDLSFHPRDAAKSRSWVVKDPVALTYFQLQEEELAILRMLDGRTSLAEIERAFVARFAPLRLQAEQILAFLNRLHQMGLVIGDARGQDLHLLEQYRSRRRRSRLGSFTNVLAIRIGAIDPEAFLQWIAPRLAWMFSFWFLFGCLSMSLSALVLVAVQFDQFQARLPDLQTFLSAGNLLWLALALMVVKVLHELGHALTCKRFGGECHEIGILVLVFTPCLYCNVSDAWLLPGKWPRVAVSAAGVIVEIVLAGLCTFLWWYSEPGLLNSLFLNMVVICSVSTVLFNGNPLLRYDGYYVLSDLLDVPNLGQRSRDLVIRGLCHWGLGIEMPMDRSMPDVRQRVLLGLYGVASMLYRCFVVFVILWICYQALLPYGLGVVAGVVAITVIVGMVFPLVWSVCLFLGNPAHRRRVQRPRTFLAVGLLILGAAAVLLIPLPYRIGAPAVLQPQDARRVYVTVAGRLDEAVSAGTVVGENHRLARLANPELDREVIELTGRRDRQLRQLQSLHARRIDEPGLSNQIPAAEEALRDIEQRLQQRKRDQEKLILAAPVPGTVIPPPMEPDQFYEPGKLTGWTGTPLDSRAIGSHLEIGSLFCLIGAPNRLEALLTIDQSDLTFVREGQRVRLQLDEFPGGVLGGKVVELAKTDLKIAPRELADDSQLAIRRDREGVARPATTSYQARVTLDEHNLLLRMGTRGRGKILVAPQPLGTRLYRSWRRLFRFGGP
jgi:putative peptide zinc metalloprotease protein